MKITDKNEQYKRLLDLAKQRYGGVAGFCKRVGINQGHFYNLKAAGLSEQFYERLKLSGIKDDEIDYIRSGQPYISEPLDEATEGIINDIREKNDIDFVDIYRKEDAVEIKIYEIPVHASIGSLAGFDDLPVSYVNLSLPFRLRKDKHIGFRITGDSMIDMGLRPGFIVIVDIKDKYPKDGDVVIVLMNGVLLLKKWKISSEGEVILASANSAVPDIKEEHDDQMTVIGVARASIELYSK